MRREDQKCRGGGVVRKQEKETHMRKVNEKEAVDVRMEGERVEIRGIK